ncbi:peptide deformylase [Patescibacteria group bacterium]|nr:peptide deformylase [Patescibacteria group bacterium]MCL5010462.1 peptide deformylase [Patescibacteria group bacterium]
MLSIVKAPNPILSQIAKKVNTITPETKTLIKEMKETLLQTRDPQGVGLAAPQVNKGLNLFIAKPTDKSPILTFINPVIKKNIAQKNRGKQKASGKLEGCLSLPSIWGEVQRSPQVVVSYLDELGVCHKRKFLGLLAIIVQHEIDHLNGILFPRRVLEQKGKLYKSHKNPQGGEEFEEIEI